MDRKQKRINDEIRATQVKLIDTEGEPIGIIPLARAIEMAEEKEMDVVEIGTQDGVVLAKIMDYGKFLFKQQKTLSKNKGGSKKNELKTIRLTYTIGDHDMEVRRKQAERFAAEGHPLKVSLMLKGRENHYGEAAMAKITEFIASIETCYKLDGRAIRTGNVFSATLTTKK